MDNNYYRFLINHFNLVDFFFLSSSSATIRNWFLRYSSNYTPTHRPESWVKNLSIRCEIFISIQWKKRWCFLGICEQARIFSDLNNNIQTDKRLNRHETSDDSFWLPHISSSSSARRRDGIAKSHSDPSLRERSERATKKKLLSGNITSIKRNWICYYCAREWDDVFSTSIPSAAGRRVEIWLSCFATAARECWRDDDGRKCVLKLNRWKAKHLGK